MGGLPVWEIDDCGRVLVVKCDKRCGMETQEKGTIISSFILFIFYFSLQMQTYLLLKFKQGFKKYIFVIKQLFDRYSAHYHESIEITKCNIPDFLPIVLLCHQAGQIVDITKKIYILRSQYKTGNCYKVKHIKSWWLQTQGCVVALWLALSPRSKEALVWILAGTVLCGVCRVFSCMCGFSQSTVQKHTSQVNWWLLIASRCACVWVWRLVYPTIVQ